ncbi:MAG TPA: DeoR/GlpR family DNA-binding transcription regulator, partial [Steroidobacteraceae bacterium]
RRMLEPRNAAWLPEAGITLETTGLATMFAPERHNAITKIVREQRRLNFADLQKRVNVSPATLRRDLTELEKVGEIIRVHGGVMDPSYVRSEISFDERLFRNSSAKKAIAAKAGSLIPRGAVVFVDAGSTCLEAGKALLGRKDVRIITHSVALIAEARRGEADAICIGGDLRKVSGALVGGNALGVLSVIHADFAFIGASGLDVDGCSTTELSEAEIKKAILTRAKRKLLLADFAKWRNPSSIRFAKWPEFDDWITDKSPSSKDTKNLRSGGLAIHLA